MKYLILFVSTISVLTSCSHDNLKEAKYDIYSSVLDSQFGHFSSNTPYVIGINETINDFNSELEVLKYSVRNNEFFFKEYCKGDTSFKTFIQSVKPLDVNEEVMEIKKLQSKTNINIRLERMIETEKTHHSINFSNIIFNKEKNKAILYITGNSSGSLILVSLVNKKWAVKHKILLWVI